MSAAEIAEPRVANGRDHASSRAAAVPAGALVGRPDLSEAEILAAIAERLAFDGRSGPEPEIVLEAARLGKRKALAFLKKLVLPPPRSSLVMPVQPILRSHLASIARPADAAERPRG